MRTPAGKHQDRALEVVRGHAGRWYQRAPAARSTSGAVAPAPPYRDHRPAARCGRRWRVARSQAGQPRAAARSSVALRLRATRLRSTYITASTKPHAVLQPIAATNIVCTSSRAGRGNAERAGEGEHHEQAEQDLRDAVDRVEDAVLSRAKHLARRSIRRRPGATAARAPSHGLSLAARDPA